MAKSPSSSGYVPLDIIGSGSFGVIRKVQRITDGKILARKEIDYRKMTEKEKKQLVAEVNILRELRHPHIVRYYERTVDKSSCRIYIVMEYCEGGDLANIIKRCKKERKYLPEELIWNLLTQLLLALHECHHGSKTKGRPAILHRDIKPDNVFLDSQHNVKLGDFGLSKVMEHPETEFAKTYVGTPFYMSPELVNESCYNAKSDIWALGCLIYELCTLEPPFQSRTQVGLASKIRQGQIHPLPSHYSQDLYRIIQLMLNTSHQSRPGTGDLLKLDRIRFCVLEKEVMTLKSELKKKEDALSIKEQELQDRERKLILAEQDLEKRQQALVAKENRFPNQIVSSIHEESKSLGTKKTIETPQVHHRFKSKTPLSKAVAEMTLDIENMDISPQKSTPTKNHRSPLSNRILLSSNSYQSLQRNHLRQPYQLENRLKATLDAKSPAKMALSP